MGATARGSGTAPCCLYSIDRHSATGLMARAPKSAGRGPSKIAPQGGKPDRHLLRRKQNPCKGCVCPTPTVGNHKPSFVEAAKQSSCRNHVTPQGVSLPTADSGKQKPHTGYACLPPAVGKQKPSLLDASKPSICKKLSHPARGKSAPRRLRGSRAAIGSGGKKPCPF